MARPPHLNQPGGRFRESAHPNVTGRERELRAMADAVRRLIRITTNNTAGASWTADAAARLHALADSLEPDLPETPPARYDATRLPEEPHDIFPYDTLLGLYNPLALPIEMEWHPPRAVGRAVFDTPYEGPPGCLHGAILAAAFDQVINSANILSGTAGPTATLDLVYKRPTPLGVEVVFEGWVEGVDERRITSRARASVDGRTTVEATGTFAVIDRDRVMRMAEGRSEGE